MVPSRAEPSIAGCNRRRLPFNRRRLPFNRRRLPSNSRQLPCNRCRLPFNRRQLPSNRRHLPSNRCRLPSNRRRLPSNRCRLPSNRCRLPSNRRQLPSNRCRLPSNRCRLPFKCHAIVCPSNELATGRPGFPFFFFQLPDVLMSEGALQDTLCPGLPQSSPQLLRSLSCHRQPHEALGGRVRNPIPVGAALRSTAPARVACRCRPAGAHRCPDARPWGSGGGGVLQD